METKTDTLHLLIPAFCFKGEDKFYKAISGDNLPDDYEGLVMVYGFKDESSGKYSDCVFNTHIDKGERNWETFTLKFTHSFI